MTLISRLNNFPLKEIILHARLGCQMYRGKTNLEGFATYKQLCQHPIVFNGDITDVATFALLQKRFPDMDRWMIGRGLIATPNLANDIKNNNTTSTTSATSIKSFHDDIYTYYEDILFGPSHLLGKMKQIWEYLITSFPENQQFLKKIRKAKTKPQYEKAIEELFSVV